MKLHKYKNYEEYRMIQEKCNIKKLKWSHVKKHYLQPICDYILKNSKPKNIKNILCHGTRNGMEQQYFLEFFPKAYVIGTEISKTATEFQHTIQWDFHEVKEDFVNKFDIIYSNSLDHSYDPRKVLTTWINQLKKPLVKKNNIVRKKGGVLFIEYMPKRTVPFEQYSLTDCFDAQPKEIEQIINDLNLKTKIIHYKSYIIVERI